jgi:hypothetical protein
MEIPLLPIYCLKASRPLNHHVSFRGLVSSLTSRVLHTIKTKTVRLDHNIHAASQLNIMTSSKPRVITFLAILATPVSQELVADGSNIVMIITMLAVGTEDAEDLEDVNLGNGEGQEICIRSRLA